MKKSNQFYLCGWFLLFCDLILASVGFDKPNLFTTAEATIGCVVCFGFAAILEEIEKQAAE